jgi:hypothetical protein
MVTMEPPPLAFMKGHTALDAMNTIVFSRSIV